MAEQQTPLQLYRNELIDLYHKGQEAFEKQLSYLAGGGLALSIGFIKDIVGDISSTSCKHLLVVGWICLIATLITNFFSHQIWTKKINQVIKSIDEKTYSPITASRKFRIIARFNWLSVFFLASGIILIVCFVTLNI